MAKLSRFTKTITLNGRPRAFAGVSSDDTYFKGLIDEFQPVFLEFCRRYIQPHYNCIDIGANIGVTSIPIADACSEGQVIALEAAPNVFDALQTNLAANSIANARAVQCAVGDRNGDASFVANSAWGHIADRGAPVPMRTVGGIADEFDLAQIDFAKIDVEGFEPVIMKNAADRFCRDGTLVILELNSFCLVAMSRNNPLEFVEWLFDRFGNVGILSESVENLIAPRTRQQAVQIVHDNMVHHGCVDDLIVTTNPDRLRPNP